WPRCFGTSSTWWRQEPSSTRLRRTTVSGANSAPPVGAIRSGGLRPKSRTARTRCSRPIEGSAAMPERDRTERELIEGGLDRNLLVEASAGSGKTESLARRMAAGIAAGVYEVEGIAAVTFTRKAAVELRGRFQLELERRLATETDRGRRGRIEMGLGRVGGAFAGTIHAFCAHLIRERPVEAGVAPGFTELDDVNAVAFRRRALRDYLERERGIGSPALRELLEAGVRPDDLDDAFDKVSTF